MLRDRVRDNASLTITWTKPTWNETTATSAVNQRVKHKGESRDVPERDSPIFLPAVVTWGCAYVTRKLAVWIRIAICIQHLETFPPFHVSHSCSFVRRSRVGFAQWKRGYSGRARVHLFIAYIWATTVHRWPSSFFSSFFSKCRLPECGNRMHLGIPDGLFTRLFAASTRQRMHSAIITLAVRKILCPSNRARFPLKARGADMRARRHGTTLSSLRSLFGSPYNRLLVLPSRRDSPPCIPTNPLRPSPAAPQNNPPCQRRSEASLAKLDPVIARARARARVSAVLKILAAARLILASNHRPELLTSAGLDSARAANKGARLISESRILSFLFPRRSPIISDVSR